MELAGRPPRWHPGALPKASAHQRRPLRGWGPAVRPDRRRHDQRAPPYLWDAEVGGIHDAYGHMLPSSKCSSRQLIHEQVELRRLREATDILKDTNTCGFAASTTRMYSRQRVFRGSAGFHVTDLRETLTGRAANHVRPWDVDELGDPAETNSGITEVGSKRTCSGARSSSLAAMCRNPAPVNPSSTPRIRQTGQSSMARSCFSS